MSVGGETVTLSTLSFSPVIPEHHEIYICHIGDSSSISFNVNVEEGENSWFLSIGYELCIIVSKQSLELY